VLLLTLQLKDVATVGAKCPHLQIVNWSRLTMSDAGLAWCAPWITTLGVLRSCIHPDLCHLTARLAAGSPLLKELRLQECHSITNDGLMAVADSCMVLETLDVSKCSELDSGALAGFVSSSLRWRRLTTVSWRLVFVVRCDQCLADGKRVCRSFWTSCTGLATMAS
jgi:Leucine Rich repeat